MPLNPAGTPPAAPQCPPWFTAPHDLWGRPYPHPPVPAPAAALPQGPDNARLAYELALELSSRITTNKLPFQAGVEFTALESVYKLFPYARERVLHHGPAASETAALVWWMLNRDVRPFTAYWHRVSQKGLLATGDVARRFRAELEYLRMGLVEWAGLFRSIANPASGAVRPLATQNPFHQPIVNTATMATQPCALDGMVVPLPFASAYASLVQEEQKLVDQWRQATNRGSDSPLTGIALSGGGIRSATFALGILRQLALCLPVFSVDYISTVSGGGYLGSLIASAFQNDVVCKTKGHGPLGGDASDDVGAAVIGWLRGRSRAMKVDAKLVASLAGKLYSDKGVADEYEARLRDTWLIEPEQVANWGRVVRGLIGKSLPVTALQKPAPLQLWNMAINVTNLNPRMNAAMRGRHGDLYTLSRAGAECRLLGWSLPGDWTVERAMALSGAAAAPTTAESAPQWVLRVCAAFGLDLGRWTDHATGSTRPASWWQHLTSLLGVVKAEDGTAFLSDGGHVENTALYQLLRRRCGFILAIDGEEDREMKFGSLMTLQHLARVEQRIDLDIDLRQLAPDAAGRSDAHFTAIRVTYPAIGKVKAQSGVLLYVKLSLTGDEPEYVRAYKRDHPDFPHHSTLDQDFDDRRFEAYLALGEHIGAQMVSTEWVGNLGGAPTFETWMQKLAERLTER